MQKTTKNKFSISIILVAVLFVSCFSGLFVPCVEAQTKNFTYYSDVNTVVCEGGSEVNALTFEDIYQADITNEWGVVEKLGENQFLFYSKIVISGYFHDINKMVTFENNIVTGNSQYVIYVTEGSTFILGDLIDNVSQTTSNGCQIFFNEKNYQYTLLINALDAQESSIFNCVFYGNELDTRILIKTNIINCVFYNDIKLMYSTGIAFNNQIFNNIYGFLSCDFEINSKASIFGSMSINHAYENYNADLVNVFARNNQHVFTTSESRTVDTYYIDVDSDNWQIGWWGNCEGKLFRQYTFNLNVLNGNITDFVDNATVQLWKDSNLIYEGTTNSSGMIPTQTLTYGYYQQSTGDTIQNATSPYYLVVTHPEWQTYISRFYITEPLRLTVSMQEPTITGYTEVEKSDYTTIILFVISIILCIIGLALTVPLLPLISLTITVLNIIFLSEPTIFNILLIILNVTFTVIALVRAKTKNN